MSSDLSAQRRNACCAANRLSELLARRDRIREDCAPDKKVFYEREPWRHNPQKWDMQWADLRRSAAAQQPTKWARRSNPRSGSAMISVIIASVIGAFISYALTKNVMYFQKFASDIQDDLNVSQSRKEILSLLKQTPPCLKDSQPCAFTSACANTLADSDFEDKKTGTGNTAKPSFQYLSAVYGYSVGTNPKSQQFVAEFTDGSGTKNPDFSEEEHRVSGIKIKSLEIVSGLSTHADRDGKAKLKITLRAKSEGELSYKKSRVYELFVFIKEYRSNDSSHADYYKIKECVFASDKVDERFREKCNGAEGAPHVNGGGFVAFTASVAPSAFVGPNASVCDEAKVQNTARIYGNAVVSGEDITISDSAQVYENAKIGGSQVTISGNAQVYGNAVVKGHSASIQSNAKVYGSAVIMEGGRIYDSAEVYGNALVHRSYVYDNAKVYDQAKAFGAHIRGYAEVFEQAQIGRSGDSASDESYCKLSPIACTNVYGNAKVYGSAKVYGKAAVYEYGRVYGASTVKGQSRIYGKVQDPNDSTKYTGAIVDSAFARASYIYDNAKISGGAKINGLEVYDNAKISGAIVTSGYGSTRPKIYDNAEIKGALVKVGLYYGSIYGNAKILDQAQVEGRNLKVYGSAVIKDTAYVISRDSNSFHIYEQAKISGNAYIYTWAQGYGSKRIYGSAKVYGNAELCVKSVYLYGNAKVYGDTLICDKDYYLYVYDDAEVYGDTSFVYGSGYIYIYDKTKMNAPSDKKFCSSATFKETTASEVTDCADGNNSGKCCSHSSYTNVTKCSACPERPEFIWWQSVYDTH